MKNSHTNITGYILAGGKSSRMGTDKGLLLFKGREIISYVIDQLHPVVRKVVIVSNNEMYKKFDLEVIPDIITNIGPAGGILSALNHSDTEKIFIISCDMPFVTSEAIDFLIKNSVNSQITIPVLNGREQPVFGVYTRNCLIKWNELIEKDIFKLTDLINHFDYLKIEISNELFDELIFTNINTMTEFENANKI